MKKIKLAVVGCLGRMGKEIIKEINISPNCELVSAIEVKKTTIKRISKIEISYDKKIAFSKADIIIDFSTPKSSLESVFYALKLKKKLIIGTTGLNNSQIKKIKQASKKISILFAPNMSIGINLLLLLAEQASKFFFSDSSAEILDIHHKYKKDTPSGTALALGDAIARGQNKLLKKISNIKANKSRKKQLNRINFYCERKGNIIGEHSTIFTNSKEQIELKHKGFNRSIYAAGAIKAALWLSNKKKGFFNMFNVLGIG